MAPNPFLTIWLSPRETIRRIVEWNPNYCVIWLACLAGVGQAIDRSTMRDLGDKVPLAVLFTIVLIGGPLIGLLHLYISSLLLRWTGKWLGGTGSTRHLRTALAWGCLPYVFCLPLDLVAWLIAGRELFTKETPHLEAHPGLMIPFIVIGLMEVTLAIWSVEILCQTIAEVQGYRSAWCGFGNIMLSVLVPIAALLVLALILVALIKGGAALFH
ncbi:MAG: Yip1 family protein [Verrucomicrobiia bacterium]|jgi:hypothetical protein